MPKCSIHMLIVEQRKWMEKCGGTRFGYVQNYGSANDPNHFGDGGELIYEADKAHLDALLARSR